MDCPNCGERPVGMFHSYRPGTLTYKERSKGYLKCRNCETMLRQQRSGKGFFQYRGTFWVWLILFMLLMIGGIWGIMLTLDEYMSLWLNAGIGVLYGLIILGVMDEIKYRYWIIEKVYPEEDEVEFDKVSTTGYVVFTLYLVAVILGYAGIFEISGVEEWQTGYYLSTVVVYLSAVIYGALYIMNTFILDQEEESATD